MDDDRITFARSIDGDLVWMHNVVLQKAWPSPAEQVQLLARTSRERLRWLLNAVEPGLSERLGDPIWDLHERPGLLEQLDEAGALIAELVDGDECWYDHHGYCQAHQLGEKPCPHERAKAYIARQSTPAEEA